MPTSNRTAARRLILRRLLERRRVAHQAELQELLAGAGHAVSQATVSRDLAALGARKEDGGRYRLAATTAGDETAGALTQRLQQFARDISASANLVVVRTPPGAAHAVGVAVDAVAGPGGRLEQVLGCVAGDDTLIVVTRSPTGGTELARTLRELMEDSR